ncbi:MAG: hypothetical protein KGJ86_06450 [Chloroflexota bacterium]|nr:hypothetical protein [Chloroflexota bacterium]
MFKRLRAARALPSYGFLTWRLFQDPRISNRAKILLVLALLAAFLPLDALEWLPLPAGTLAVALLVMRTFVNAAPEGVRAEHLAALGLEGLE